MTAHDLPKMTDDADAQSVIDHYSSDLEDTAFRPLSWELQPKTARTDMRVPQPFLDSLQGPRQGARHPLPAPDPRGAGEGVVMGIEMLAEGNVEADEEDERRRLGPDATEPKCIEYKKFAR